MATTNFQEWNPPQNNQEPDAVYTTDSQRLNGFALDDLVPSVLLNKVLRQLGTFVTAFGQMLANKGYNNSDASVSALVAVLMNIVTQADLGNLITSVPFSATPTFDAAVAPTFAMGLTGNVTSSTLVHQNPGQKLAFIIGQDAAGGRIFTWPTNITNPGTIDPTPNAVTIQEFIVGVAGAVRALGPPMSSPS